MSITYDEAKHVLEAALAKCRSEGWAVAVAVVDAAGELMALGRLDGARPHTPSVARGKATAAAVFRRPTTELTSYPPDEIRRAINLYYKEQLVYWQGGVPILRNGQVIGGIGVSGVTSEQDEEAAKVGAAAIARGR